MDYVTFREAANCENNNYHASYQDGCLSVCSTCKGLITATTEEQRDRCHQESAMATMGEWRNGLNSRLHLSIIPSASSTHMCTYT